MQIDECFLLGYVISKRGLAGEVNIFLNVDDPVAYKKLESVFVEINQKLIPFFIQAIAIQKDKAVVKFEDVETAEAAEALKGSQLYLPLDRLPKLKPGQFYYHDIIGYTAIDTIKGEIGKIKDVYASSGQDLLAVDHADHEVLIPISDEIVTGIDHDTRQITVQLPDGLLEIYTS